MNIYTMGHSTYTIEEFVLLMKQYKIQLVVDVRSYPGSRYVPQFNKENMRVWLGDNGLEYIHLPELGGRRKGDPASDEALVAGWDKASFRNYAAYSLTEEYEKGIEKLIRLSMEQIICVVCAEALPWRCHRLIISNSLVYRGQRVFHIIGKSELIEHSLSLYGAEAVIDKGRLIYPRMDI
ncbi:MAG: DUF488 domain-containing protein [Tissierellia bacterium]|nr:DUF488 domain-containing protein [Tissierellia bacterium]